MQVKIVTKNSHELVWEGTMEDFARCFPCGLDSDNRKVYDLIIGHRRIT